MRSRRFNEEKNIIRRIKELAEKCLHTNDEVLASLVDGASGACGDASNQLSEEFVDTMAGLLAFIDEKRTSQLSIKMLSNLNIYKSPRELFKRVMMNRAEELLRTSGDDIADIAEKCHFSSPNYFIGSFFHKFHMLPDEYRRKAVRRQ